MHLTVYLRLKDRGLPSFTDALICTCCAVQLSASGCEAVSKLKTLMWLEAAGGFLCDKGVQLLCQLTRLTSLSIAQNPRVTDTSYESLTQLPHLKTLNISGTAMSAPSAEFLKSMPHMRCLSLYGIRIPEGYRDIMGRSFSHVQLCGIKAAG